MGILYRHRSSLEHDTGAHPENARRIVAIERALDEAGWPGLELREPPRATRAMLERVHSPAHVDRIERFCEEGGGYIDADTVATDASWEAALHGAGAVAEGAERLLAGEDSFAFCALRPPGHHAERERAMGFCLLNSVAVGAAHAVAECDAGRALILDWDVHHGNGTADIFDASSEVLFASIHQSPLYPGTGAAHETGTGEGEGYTVNLPVPPGSGGDEFLGLIQRVVVPIARELSPGLLLISAGYDAHERDPLANCEVTTTDFAEMAAAMRDLGRELDVPVLVTLEGGYDTGALAESVLATVRALGDDGPARTAGPSAVVDEAVARVASGRWSGAVAS